MNVDQVTLGSSYHPSEEYGIEMSDAESPDRSLLDGNDRSDVELNGSRHYGKVNILPVPYLFSGKWMNDKK